MNQAPFHFHCIICFDAFNLEDRPPVVLPCGHTYLCEPCSKRLKRCMECRTPLFQTTTQTAQGGGPTVPLGMERRGSNGAMNNTPVSAFRSPSSPTPNTPVNRRYQPSPSYRYGYQHNSNTYSQGQHPHSPNGGAINKVEPVPLPCPKNLVLMSIMEATQRRHLISSSSSCEEDHDVDKENEFEIHDNDHHILDGITEIASNSSGTYVVREKNGLVLHTKHPFSNDKASQENNNPIEHKVQTLKYGQQVQISEERDGVYVLARRQGYIVASNSQIVRVGAARDLSCQIEGTLCSVRNSRRNLLQQASNLEQIEVRLQHDYDDALSKPVTHAIIHPSEGESERSYSLNIHQKSDSERKLYSCPTEDSLDCRMGVTASESMSLSHENNDMTLTLTENDHLSPGQSIEISTPTPSSPPALNNSFITADTRDDGKNLFIEDSTGGLQLGIPGLSDAIEDMDLNVGVVSPNDDTQSEIGDYSGAASRSMMCGSSIFPLLRRAWSDDDTDDEPNHNIDLTYEASMAVSHIRPRTSDTHAHPSAVDQGPYDSNAGRSFDGVDFRTGLSGHNALNRRYANKPNHYTGMVTRREIRMMSEHRGIGSIKKVRNPQSPRS